tara:strand:- start:504 stop:749 length:246 start_codon:yes stop_codon:yes gene_type:complete
MLSEIKKPLIGAMLTRSNFGASQGRSHVASLSSLILLRLVKIELILIVVREFLTKFILVIAHYNYNVVVGLLTKGFTFIVI